LRASAPGEVVGAGHGAGRLVQLHETDAFVVGRPEVHPQLGVDVEIALFAAGWRGQVPRPDYVGGLPVVIVWAGEYVVEKLCERAALKIVGGSFQPGCPGFDVGETPVIGLIDRVAVT